MSAADALLAVLPNIHAVVNRFAARDQHDADELTQIAAVRFLTYWPTFRGAKTGPRLGGWAKSIARSAVLVEYRKRETYRRNLERFASGETSCGGGGQLGNQNRKKKS